MVSLEQFQDVPNTYLTYNTSHAVSCILVELSVLSTGKLFVAYRVVLSSVTQKHCDLETMMDRGAQLFHHATSTFSITNYETLSFIFYQRKSTSLYTTKTGGMNE